MQRWESFHVEGRHCGALFRDITPERLLTRIAFPLDEDENYLVESVIVRDGSSWQSMTFWQQPGDVDVTAQRGPHGNKSMPGYGEFLILQDMIAGGHEHMDFDAIIDSAPEGKPATAGMQLLGIDDIPVEDATPRRGHRIDVTIADTVTSSHWVEDDQIVASDWKGALSFLRASADEALQGVDRGLVDFLREGRNTSPARAPGDASATTTSPSIPTDDDVSGTTYTNPLRTCADLDGWIAEGPHHARETPDGLEFRSTGGDDDGHWVLWCPEVFGDRIRITWEFSPRSEPGLAMLFFGATSITGGGIFDDGLGERVGTYSQYHSSDIRTLHASYFRRRFPSERAFHLANLRKAPGAHLVAQGADPLPSVEDAEGFYRMEVVKDGASVTMSINELLLWSWRDDEALGPRIRSGRVGFRQMSPLVACYRNLVITDL